MRRQTVAEKKILKWMWGVFVFRGWRKREEETEREEEG